MDICVCGTQVPFTQGGAELHLANLVTALREAGHRVEPVVLPTAWDRDRILDAAAAWRLVPLDFDLAITLNFPSYFARHPRKVAWVLHQHRGAYDGLGQPWSDFGLDDTSLAIHAELVAWDTAALERGRAPLRQLRRRRRPPRPLQRPRRRSRSTTRRRSPTASTRGPSVTRCCASPASRANKRPDLFVEAMGLAAGDARGVLMGRGSFAPQLEHRIAELAEAGLGRPVEMTGFVPDDDLVARLATALAVVYSPFDEDYGYATLQAFLAGKPVITTPDSGGVLEWVEHEVTGLVTDGTPQGMADAIDRLAADADLAAGLGAAGRARAEKLSWAAVVETLVGPTG